MQHASSKTSTDNPFWKEVEDEQITNAIHAELNRQRDVVELIASENIVSEAVLRAQGSTLTNKYAEGYPGRRYYGGCSHIDDIEQIGIERAKVLFQCNYANLQPHSGSAANQAVFQAFLKPKDTILSMSLSAGGHLTHGAPVSQSGQWFDVVHYGVRVDSGLVDYDEVRDLAIKHKPRLIIAGFSSYSRILDWSKFRDIADEVGAILMVDMAHIAGLVATGYYPSPLPFAHVVTTTTHKTLRGPRGGMILSDDDQYFKKINSAVFPGIQGGPLMHVIAAKAIAFKEAQQAHFKSYIKQVITNAQLLADSFIQYGIPVVSGGTDNHMLVLDLRPLQITGAVACSTLEKANIITNKNAIPYDPLPPAVTSGIRIGTAAITTRGFTEKECIAIAAWMKEILHTIQRLGEAQALALCKEINNEVKELCDSFPIYTNL